MEKHLYKTLPACTITFSDLIDIAQILESASGKSKKKGWSNVELMFHFFDGTTLVYHSVKELRKEFEISDVVKIGSIVFEMQGKNLNICFKYNKEHRKRISISVSSENIPDNSDPTDVYFEKIKKKLCIPTWNHWLKNIKHYVTTITMAFLPIGVMVLFLDEFEGASESIILVISICLWLILAFLYLFAKYYPNLLIVSGNFKTGRSIKKDLRWFILGFVLLNITIPFIINIASSNIFK